MNPATQVWDTPPARPTVGGDEVHLWRAHLKQPPGVLSSLRGWLSAGERERAARFHFDRDRERFVAARAALRDVLGRYLRVAPGLIQFAYGEHGKPGLGGESAASSLTFNLSHSRELALVAVARSKAVGVDVEFVREDFACAEVAARFFSPDECSALGALPPGAPYAEGFFNCWTRKEAYIKARGLGLSIPLDSFTVSLAPGETARLLRADDEEHGASRWSLLDVCAGEGYAAALAAEGTISAVGFWEWRP